MSELFFVVATGLLLRAPTMGSFFEPRWRIYETDPVPAIRIADPSITQNTWRQDTWVEAETEPIICCQFPDLQPHPGHFEMLLAGTMNVTEFTTRNPGVALQWDLQALQWTWTNDRRLCILRCGGLFEPVCYGPEWTRVRVLRPAHMEYYPVTEFWASGPDVLLLMKPGTAFEVRGQHGNPGPISLRVGQFDPCDLDMNGVRSILDFQFFVNLQGWDYNQDGQVNAADYLAVLEACSQ